MMLRWLALDYGAGDTVRAEQYAAASSLWRTGAEIVREDEND
jgi:hypothetical protein